MGRADEQVLITFVSIILILDFHVFFFSRLYVIMSKENTESMSSLRKLVVLIIEQQV